MPAFQFPSWYTPHQPRLPMVVVLPAFQFPSWYTRGRPGGRRPYVLPAFQFPSWYTPCRLRSPSGRSCRPSNSPVGTLGRDAAPDVQPSCRPSNSPVGTLAELKQPLRAGAVSVSTDNNLVLENAKNASVGLFLKTVGRKRIARRRQRHRRAYLAGNHQRRFPCLAVSPSNSPVDTSYLPDK